MRIETFQSLLGGVPVTWEFMADGYHLGTDLGTRKGTPGAIMYSGYVHRVFNEHDYGDGSFGTGFIVKRSSGEWPEVEQVYDLYAHCEWVGYREGQYVWAGDVGDYTTGNSGKTRTGRPYDPHLHVQSGTDPAFPRFLPSVRNPFNEEDEVTYEMWRALSSSVAVLQDQMDKVADTVNRIDSKGVIRYTDGVGYDMIKLVNNQNDALKREMARIDDAILRIEILEDPAV